MTAAQTTLPDAGATAPAVPALRAVLIHRRLHALRLRRGRLRYAAIALLGFPIVATAVALPFARDVFDTALDLYFGFLLPFVPAIAASALVAEEIDGKTFTFVFARPAARWALVVGKYLAVTGPLIALFVISIALCYCVGSLRGTTSDFTDGLPHLARVLAVVVVGVPAYGALAAGLGTLATRHPFVVVMSYLISIEAGIGSLGVVFNLVAMSWHLRNLAGLTLPSSSFFTTDVHVPPWASALMVLGLGSLSLLGAALAISGAEYRTDR